MLIIEWIIQKTTSLYNERSSFQLQNDSVTLYEIVTEL